MITAKKARLGVHYHAPFYKDSSGNIYLVSSIGLWLEALSVYWGEVVYIGHQTNKRLREQDHLVKKEGLTFLSVGEPGGLLSLAKRVHAMKQAVKKSMNDIDALIVRAPTSRQGTIYGAFNKKCKALYIVGKPPKKSILTCLIKGGMKAVINEMLNRRREIQTSQLADKAIVIANSMELCRQYKAKLGKEVYYCPSSSLMRENFHHVEDRCSGETIKLLFVGRVCRDKGIMELLGAAVEMKTKGKKVFLDIVGGSGDADNIEDFKKMCEEEQIEDMVRWHDRVPYGHRLFEMYHQADMLILPSHHEGFPRVIQEAMANGVLVLVTNVGGIRDVCSHEREVYFVDGDPESIVDAVTLLEENVELRKNMLQCGYKYARKSLLGENEKRLTEILTSNWTTQ